jgi:hypothetical protein
MPPPHRHLCPPVPDLEYTSAEDLEVVGMHGGRIGLAVSGLRAILRVGLAHEVVARDGWTDATGRSELTAG